jgi:predicted nucleic acid-binding protein
MVLVDSGIWIDFFNDVPSPKVDIFVSLVQKRQALSGDLILTEVLQGFRDEGQFQLARRLMSDFTTVSLVNRMLAHESAANFRKLREKGVTVRKTIDCLIATWCIENGVPLLHSDKDFEPFEQHLGLVTL